MYHEAGDFFGFGNNILPNCILEFQSADSISICVSYLSVFERWEKCAVDVC